MPGPPTWSVVVPARALVPASFFAIVLGTIGLGNAWRVATKLWGLPAAIGETIIALGAIVWMSLLILYSRKWIVAPEAARRELEDPVQCCFVGLIGVTGLLTFLPGRVMYQVAFGPDGATPQKLMIFGAIVGAALILSGIVMVVRRRQLKTVVA